MDFETDLYFIMFIGNRTKGAEFNVFNTQFTKNWFKDLDQLHVQYICPWPIWIPSNLTQCLFTTICLFDQRPKKLAKGIQYSPMTNLSSRLQPKLNDGSESLSLFSWQSSLLLLWPTVLLKVVFGEVNKLRLMLTYFVAACCWHFLRYTTAFP